MKPDLAAILALSLFFNGGLMGEQSPQPAWVALHDEETGLQAQFPHNPVEMNIEFPFQNTPPDGQLRFYSAPTSKGLLALTTFFSSTFNEKELEKEHLREFFEKVLVPHLFFDPSIFKDHQTYHFLPKDQQGRTPFQFSFKDKGLLKQLEGIALVQEQTLYIAFYMVSKNDFDPEIYHRFLDSIQFPGEF